jgi:tyrosyl-tRNA synthetase
MTTVYDELKWRGLLYLHTEGLPELLAKDKLVAYIGFDPTAPSLHVGNLLTVLGLARLQRFGHTPIAVVGGGTGMIGDPSGKSEERNLLSREQVDANASGIQAQLEKFLDFDEGAPNKARIVNNADWLGTVDVLSFLRDTGKHFTVNYMLEKESVSRRIESESGISYTEFSYLILQAYDFLQLFDRYGCTLQMGGSDQWGNITAGTELIRKLRGKKAHGLVWPLLKTASGGKFGKTEKGTIWLDPERTSPFRFYQFWLNTHDQDVETYFKYFIEPRSKVDELLTTVPADADARYRQRVLARELTRLVHGSSQADRAERASTLLFTEDIASIPVDDVLAVYDDVPSTALPIDELDGEGIGVVDLVVRVALAPSRSEARRLVQSGGIYVNNRRVSDPQARVTRDQAIGGRLLLLRKGQKQNHLARLT